MLLAAMGRTLLLALLGLFFACIIGMIFGIMGVDLCRCDPRCTDDRTCFLRVLRRPVSVQHDHWRLLDQPDGVAGRHDLSGPQLRSLYGGDHKSRHSVRRQRTDGSSQVSWSYIRNGYEKGGTASGDPDHDPHLYQPVYHYAQDWSIQPRMCRQILLCPSRHGRSWELCT